MIEISKRQLEFSSPTILDMAAILRDAFLHSDIPEQQDSMIPNDKTFVQMAQYLEENRNVWIQLTHKKEKNNA